MGRTGAEGLILGELEWKEYGGSVTRRSHPCGRFTITYFTPNGLKLRSWKTCQDYMKEHPRLKVTRKAPKSRPKKKGVKSKKSVEVVDLSKESTPVSNSEHDEFDEGEVKPEMLESVVDKQLPIRKSLIEELVPNPEEEVSPLNSEVKTATAEPASASKGTYGSPEMAPEVVKFSKSEGGLKDVKHIHLGEIPELQTASHKFESALRGVSTVGAGNVNVLNQEEQVDKKQNNESKTSLSKYLPECATDSDFDVTSEVSEVDGSDHECFKEDQTKRKKRASAVSNISPGSSKKSRTATSGGTSGHNNKEGLADSSETSRSDDDEVIRKNSSSRPKRAAAATNFKEKRIRLDERNSMIECKKEVEAEDETTMLMMMRSTCDSENPEVKVSDFVLHDGEGNLMQIDALTAQTSYLAGLCISKGALDKVEAVRCELLGPVIAWSIMGYEKDCVEIVLSTNYADYYLDKPAPNYRRIYNPLYDQARVCREVYRALSRPDGGDPTMGLQDLELRLIRLYSNMGTSGQFFCRDYFHNIGNFVAGQLYALDDNPPDGCQLFTGLRALEELQEISVGRRALRLMGERFYTESTVGTCQEDANTAGGCAPIDDYELARRLQDEEDGFLETAVDLASRRLGAARQAPAAKGKFYVKINENEIANDYPEPAYYKSDEPETDEYVLFGEDVHPDDEHFPHRFLDDWALYNSEIRLVPLELIPMLPCAENDMQIFGSGVITEDDGSGYYHEDDGAGRSVEGEGGFRVFLSAVKEWKVEWGSGMVIISFRTDVSWYRLGTPSKQYVDWYAPVLKTAKVAVKIITMLKEQNRVSRLSFKDVVKKLAEQGRTEPTWISSKQVDVERYIIVHGQILLQQIEEFPNQLIQKCGFKLGLQTKMEQKSHEKLSVSKRRVLIKKEVNLNPRAKLPSSTISKKNKPMRATTTQLVNRIWSGYFESGITDADQPREDERGGKDADVLPEELIEEDSDDDIVEVIQPPVSLSPPKSITSKCSTPATRRSPNKSLWKSSDSKVKWGDVSSKKTREGYPVYRKALFNGLELTVGKVIVASSESVMRHFLIEYLYESDHEGPMIHGRLLIKGEETILGDAANERELFLTEACADVRIGRVKELVIVEMRQRSWGHGYRKENAVKDEADRDCAKERKRKGLSLQYYCRFLWSPEKGAYLCISVSALARGSGICNACETRQETEKKMEVEISPEGKGFRCKGVDYRINDFLYLDPKALNDSKPNSSHTPSERITHKGGRNKGLQAFIICQLLSIQSQRVKMKAASCTMKVRRFYRPEDIDKMKAYRAQLHEVYYSDEISVVEMSSVRGKCEVRRIVQDLDTSKGAFDHVFVCDYIHDPKTQTIKHLPANIRLGSSNQPIEATCSRTTRAKGKGKAKVDEETSEQPNSEAVQLPGLATLDIFAGCGGLSEGLHQSGVSVTKWAIEYDREAADAFKLNHPSAEVFCDNCNVVLRAIMERGGDLDDCLSPPEADDLCAKMDGAMKAKLPAPGEVDFINGGPPCQGFSGMNRFNQRVWSKVQCEMILAFLSYADYYRPRYFLLENVRNFISFNKGQTFRLTVASLLEMGYQVRFGVLQAGNFGVAQSRKRAFIWAAGPKEVLPEWPEPRHVFASSQLGISLPGGGQYSAAKDAGQGAPFRPITVRDTLADLPAVLNGANTQTTVYTLPAESWFQKQIRGNTDILIDHISKEMNELNMIRCKRIPMKAGADWRDLPDEKVKLSTGQVVDLIPWCLPNTAARHNQWKGLFGRLDWDGNFPTSITDPQPMGKVGMCFHPVQNRIVTVRECARSQGFPDLYKFAGNIICKHRQIGNAVPPPLACALGYELKKGLNFRKEFK